MTSPTSGQEESPLPHDETFGGINELARLLRDLDERGLVLALSAFAEDALGDLLRAFLIPSDAVALLLDGFNAPLGTFSSRIKAAYAMGLLTEAQYKDLERLRKIRNEFAHAWRPVSLSQQKLDALARGMRFGSMTSEYPETARDKVLSSIRDLLVELRVTTSELAKNRQNARLVGNHLMVGFSGQGFEEQAQQARLQLSECLTNGREAEGDRRTFHVHRLRQLLNRVTVLPQTSPEEVQQRAVLAQEIRAAITELEPPERRSARPRDSQSAQRTRAVR